jgi:hypothetical protein
LLTSKYHPSNYAKNKDMSKTRAKIIKVGGIRSFRKSFIDALKYSIETPTHGCTGEMMYPKNILV